MGAIPVSDGIWWVGGIDWNLRDFHGYETPRGTTYNAYLVKGADKVALVDTVKTPFVDELLHRVSTVVPLDQVDHIVVNHIEPDHNSGLKLVMDAMPQASVVATRSGAAGVALYHDGLSIGVVGADDTIDLGGKTLHFQPAPMVHWPDSMFTYCPESATLMPNDAFGQHVASSARFADELGMDESLRELGVYWANILSPLGTQVGKAVAKIGERGWEPQVIAPSHGVVWRGPEAIGAAMGRYARWEAAETCPKVIIAYGTMWGSTDLMARAIAEGVSEAGAVAKLYDLAETPLAWIQYQLLEAKALLLGSPTLHHTMLYRVSGYLAYLEGLEPPGKLAGTFGSFGWGGGAIKHMDERLAAIGFEMPFESLGQKFKPHEEDLEKCREWGRVVGRTVAEAGCTLPAES
jgi:anaerobic nitric oxide reductase flavorubredoxin